MPTAVLMVAMVVKSDLMIAPLKEAQGQPDQAAVPSMEAQEQFEPSGQ